MKKKDKKIARDVLWFGTGSMTENILPSIQSDYVQIVAFIDERPGKKGSIFHGAPVITPDEIKNYAYEYIFIGARPYNDIADKLHQFGIPYEKMVSLDFEVEAKLVAARFTSFTECFASYVRHASILDTVVDKDILFCSDWFKYILHDFPGSYLVDNAVDSDMRIAVCLQYGVGDSLIALAWLKELYINSPVKLHIDVFIREDVSMPPFALPFIRNWQPARLFLPARGYDIKLTIYHFILVREYSQRAQQSQYFSGLIEKIQIFADRYAKYSEKPLYHGAWADFCALRGWNRWDVLGASEAIPFSRAGSIAPDWDSSAFSILQQHDLQKKTFFTLHSGGDERAYPGGVGVKILPQDCWTEFCNLCKRVYPDILLVQLGSAKDLAIQGVDICLAGKTSWHETLVILKHGALHIDGESGLVHLRRQLRGQSVVLFGPTPVSYYGYAHNRNIISPVCNNCMGATSDWYANCPKGLPEAECLRAISPERVLLEVEGALADYTEYRYAVDDISLYSNAGCTAFEPVLEDICRVCGVEKQPVTKSIAGPCRTYIHASKQWEYPYTITVIEGMGKPPLKIADVGSGRGMLSWYLAKKGHDVIAYDQNFSHASRGDVDLNRRFVQFAKGEGFCAEYGSIFNIPAEDNTFDIVTCISVVEHIPWKFYAFKEMLRVLKPGGKLITTYDLTLAGKEQYGGNRLDVFTAQNIAVLMQELQISNTDIHTEEAILASMNDIQNDNVQGIGGWLTVGGFVLTKIAQ